MKTAVYPGTFDPLTMGHLDLIERSSQLFDKLIVAVAGTSAKSSRMFSFDERFKMVQDVVDATGRKNIEVKVLDTLLIDFCRKQSVNIIVRGVRVYSDFEYEFQMALTNRKLNPQVETLFLMPNEEYSYITASTVREVARYGGEINHFVPPVVQERLQKYLFEHPEQMIKTTGGSVGDTGAFDR